VSSIRGRRFGSNVRVLKPVRPSVGLALEYQRRLDAMVTAMHDSVAYWLEAAYKKNEPRIAQDELPADVLNRTVARLAKRWLKNFDEAAEEMADYFARDVQDRSEASLKKILRDAGWRVPFKMTPAMRDVFKSTVNQNVALIKSIPQQYLSGVEQLVQESVQAGRDMGSLTKSLREKYGVTKRRAALISHDQNNKATSAFNRARRLELGLDKAIWMHSHAGEVPRPSHVKMDGKEFDTAKGMWDPDEGKWIQPGELIRCRCTARPIVAGLE
jgi:uncharacterized protein with gpF-like domain